MQFDREARRVLARRTLRAVVLVLAVAAMAGGCALDKRDFSQSTASVLPFSGASGAKGSGNDAGSLGSASSSLAAQGAACTQASECATGYCTDGVCCDRACGELCATCVAPGSVGTCSAAAGDAACAAASCGISTECRGFDTTQASQNCESFGVCRTNATCTPLLQPASTPCRNGQGTCDGQGECVVAGAARLGASCANDADCGSGHCVQGTGGSAICCEAACDGPCQQCGANGRCDQMPATDAKCAAVTCPADNVCLDYPPSLTDSLCRALGQCKTALDCPSTALRPPATCDCDNSGACTLARGARCDSDIQCTSSACQADADGTTICCAQHCGAGLICASDGSACVECEPGSPVQCSGNNAVTCNAGTNVTTACPNGCTDGVGCNTNAPVGFACSSSACVAGAVCEADQNGVQRCCVRDCAAEGKVCADNGSCVCPPGQSTSGSGCLLQQGDPCGAAGAQCGAGLTCVDGVCCNEACGGACERCNVPGSVGQCTFDSLDKQGCSPGEQCVARSDCRAGLGASCKLAGDCVSSNCMPVLGVAGAQICCAQACSGQQRFCSSDGNNCIQCATNADCPNGCTNGLCNPLGAPGALCTLNSQCGSNACLTDSVDPTKHRCCAGCSANQTCGSDGSCVTPPAKQGTKCGAGLAACGSGLFCVDGVCCNSQCNGACLACDTNGVCQQLVGSSTCPAGQQCLTSSSDCQTVVPNVGQPCATGQICTNGATCLNQVCPEFCHLSSVANPNDGSKLDGCVLQ